MTSNRSFSNEASSQLTPLHAALAGTSLGTTTTSRGINHSLASEMLVIYSRIYASLVLARRESRFARRDSRLARRESRLARRESHLARRDSRLARRETRGGNLLLSGTVNIDKDNVNVVVFLDLKKAFDTVDHTILIIKNGVTGVTYNWFNSYLDDRKQKCCLSDSKQLLCGIPQGTILGLLLFLLYINDLPKCLSISQPRMYADDTHLTFASNDVTLLEENMNNELTKVSEWLIAKKLALNRSKTEFTCMLL